MSGSEKQVHQRCAHVDLKNYTCDYLENGKIPGGPVCDNCLTGLYVLWKESIWTEAKERSGKLFPDFGIHGHGKAASP